MADDIDAPHCVELGLESTLPLQALITIILNDYQLPSVASPMIYWICKINQRHVATIIVADNLATRIHFEESNGVEFSSMNKVHFNYSW